MSSVQEINYAADPGVHDSTETNPLAENTALLPKTTIPLSTYRLQLNHQFTFRDAIQLIPYLKRLGISHCYASPLLTARPGSLHGYDIVDHHHINPEIGTHEEFEAFCRQLQDNQIGLIVDIVPNHMGIGQDNIWWMDILENGQASSYSNYFDIHWRPLKDELRGKLLLPILGQQYGEILENGEFKITFNPEQGSFQLSYYDHRWPLNPNTYPLILNAGLDTLIAQFNDANAWPLLEYQSIITAFENLPFSSILDDSQREVRKREKTIALKRLSDLCQKELRILAFIQANVSDFNDVQNKPDNQQRLHKLINKQSYRLAYWRVASDEINYRRFFDVNDLAGLNINEVPELFQETHQLIFDWVQKGFVSGLRIDHPDGLYNPEDYFRQLQTQAACIKGLLLSGEPIENLPAESWPLYLVAEKILARYEDLPNAWPLHGSSGYEFGNLVNGLFIPGKYEETMTQLYERLTDSKTAIQEEIYHCKKLIIQSSLSSELSVLSDQLNRLSEQDWRTRDFTSNTLRQALMEVVAAFPVYRTYITPNSISKKDKEYIQWAVGAAKKRAELQDLSVFDFIHKILTLDFAPYHTERYIAEATRFTMKFQQYTGPVMAKGLEDTCFYRYNRLISMNEVGGDLAYYGVSVSAFHHQNLARQKFWPHTMLNSSTHDSKRSEDVRARINVLSEMPTRWSKQVERWMRMNRLKKTELDKVSAPDANDEYLLYQTLLGVWPNDITSEHLNRDKLDNLCERLEAYMIKATREAKVHTSWIQPNTAYEDALIKFIRGLLETRNSNPFLDEFLEFHKVVSFFGAMNSLAQTALKLTVPGVPDIYQGNELLDFSLVDPDNRRPVDYEVRRQLTDQYAVAPDPTADEALKYAALFKSLQHHDSEGVLKLMLTQRCLHYRRENPDVFLTGLYTPLEATGYHAEKVVAFSRHTANQGLLVLVPRLFYSLTRGKLRFPTGKSCWKDTQLNWNQNVGGNAIKNLMTGEVLPLKPVMSLTTLVKSYPIGLFEILY